MDKNRAIELFEKAKGITRPSQKINAYKQKYGWLVLRESIQYNVTDKMHNELAEIHDKGFVIERNKVILRFKK